MVRGHAKDVARERNAKKQEAGAGKRSGAESAALRSAAAPIVCANCRASLSNPRVYLEHWQNKHSKLPLPPDLASIKS